ncbi:MAG: type II toxin-antitoxin system prevent-host-death family antitoxin [Isosphaeraceae bacterium]
MEIADIHAAKGRLSQLVASALSGEEVIIARDGLPIVRLVPIRADETPRSGGQWKGRVRIADDFDAWPPEIAEAFGA